MDQRHSEQRQKHTPQQEERPRQSSSSSSWEQPISDTQAVEISDYIMTHEEEQAFFSDEEACADSRQKIRRDEALQQSDTTINDPEGEEISPSWEHAWHNDMQQPAALPEENSGDFWETWLEEIKQLPRSGYKPFDDLLKSPHYNNQT